VTGTCDKVAAAAAAVNPRAEKKKKPPPAGSERGKESGVKAAALQRGRRHFSNMSIRYATNNNR
jgi:hypothetical protein